MKKDFSFKKAFEELRKITAEFEAGEIDLEEGLKKFERGLELARLCRERLKETENKIIEIKKKFGINQKNSEDLKSNTQKIKKQTEEEIVGNNLF